MTGRLSAGNKTNDMGERYIASVDLGTSKIAVCVASVQGKDTQVIYYKETPSAGVQKSAVTAPGRTTEMVRSAITEAQQALKMKIKQVIVGLPRWCVKQETATASVSREDSESLIGKEEIRQLKNNAVKSYPMDDSKKHTCYGAIAQSFSTEDSIEQPESEIIDMPAETLEGNFTVFIGSKRHSMNIDKIFDGIPGITARKCFIPGITAKAVLTGEQMKKGVALFDLGAGVSSVTIFKNGIMKYFGAIPFGGNAITDDIESECNVSHSLAENIKKAYGACMPDDLASFGGKTLLVDGEDGKPFQVTVKYISEIVTARMKEIVEALLYKIEESGLSSEDILKCGIVVTGGGAELINCTNYIKELSGYTVKKGVPAKKDFSCEGWPEAGEASAATSMGMILYGKDAKSLNCIQETVTISTIDTVKAVRETEKEEKKPVAEREEKPATVQERKPEPPAEPVYSTERVKDPETKTASEPERRLARVPETTIEPEPENDPEPVWTPETGNSDANDRETKAKPENEKGRGISWKKFVDHFKNAYKEMNDEEV